MIKLKGNEVKGLYKKLIRRGISLLLVSVICLGMIVSTTIDASADSNQRIAAFIQLAADGEVTDADVTEVTESELRFLGLYLSNFFVPFGTELGTEANRDLEDETKADMIATLQTKLAFSDTFAEEVVETVYGYMRSSLQSLEIRVSGEWQDGNYIPISCIDPNYFNFLRLMEGRADDVLYKYYYRGSMTGKEGDVKDNISKNMTELVKEISGSGKSNLKYSELSSSQKADVDVLYGILNGDYNYLYFGYNGANGFTPVFDCGLDWADSSNYYTPSQTAFFKCLEACDIEKGYGFCYSDFSVQDGIDSDKMNELVNGTSGASDEQILEMSMWGTHLAVDCFGDIISIGGNHQMVLVPGCMNPYSWRGVDFNGSDSAVLNAGAAYNMANSLSMIQTECINVPDGKNELIKGISAKGVTNIIGESSNSVNVNSDSGESDSQETGNSYDNTSLETSSKKTPEPSGDLEAHRSEVASRRSTSSKNSSSKTSSSNSSKSSSSNKDVSSSSSNGGSGSSRSRSRSNKKYGINIKDTDLDEIVVRGTNTVKEVDLNKGNGRAAFTPNFCVLNDKISNDSVKASSNWLKSVDDDLNVLTLRVMRGDVSSEYPQSIFGVKESPYKDFASKAQQVFAKRNPCDRTWYYSTHNGNCDDGMIGYGSFKGWFYGNVTSENTISLECVVPEMEGNYGAYWIGRDSLPLFKTGVKPGSFKEGSILYSNIVFIDNLGAYSDPEMEYTAFNVESFVNEDGQVLDDLAEIELKSEISFGSIYKDIQDGRLDIPNKASEQALSTLYVTYCWACLYDEGSKAETIGRLGYRFNVEGFPEMGDNPIMLDSAGADGEFDAQKAAIQNWIYYLLHPTDGMDYFKILFTNKINSFLLSKHADMVGTNGTSVTVGTTKYRSTMGYVTMPDLSEIQWTNSLIGFYNEAIPILIVILMIIMLFAFITGALNMQHALAGLLVFSIFTFIPVNLINGLVEQSNRISQNIYGNKFTYWALVQQESYAKAIDQAANAQGSDGTSSYGNYLRTLYSENQQVYTNQGTESILVKWQAPKKMASLVLSESDAKSVSGLSTVGQKMLSGMLNKTYSGQSYVDDEEAVYMYRSYLDLSNFSRYIYDGIKNARKKTRSTLGGFGVATSGSVNSANWTEVDTTLASYDKYIEYVNNGYTNGVSDLLNDYSGGSDIGTDTSSGSESTVPVDTSVMPFYLSAPLSSNVINDVFGTDVTSFTSSSQNVPINADIFNFGIPMFNNQTLEFNIDNFAATGNISEGTRKDNLKKYMDTGHNGEAYTEEDYTGLAVFGLYSENPYYYFSWKLYSDGLESSSSLLASNYKKLILGKENGGYFYNTVSNNELKDFMDMRGLFTNIIPYMKQCNDIVRDFDNTFGIFVYDGVPTEEGHWEEVENDPELAAKYWHNLQVTRLYCLYCPWVDVMYDCSYAKAETISVMGKKYTVDDPINPKSYPEDRPMIFSASEMVDYGLNEADLTKVERIILKCNEQYEERLYDLLNYYNFSDVSLDSAAAINCAFVFNNMFSENGVFSDNHNIYPQSFDLSNFSFDAFLRFMLSNATGESMLSATKLKNTVNGNTSGDFYERIVNNSSMVTVLVMIVLDIISLYLLPSVRIFFLLAIFLASILMVLISAFRIEDNMKFIKKVGSQFFLPLLLFFGSTVAFSMVISLFMGKANNQVTQDADISISMGDPVVTMLIVTVLSIVLLIVYVIITIRVIKDIKHSSKLINGFVGGIGGSIAGAVSGAISDATSGIGALTSGVVSLGRGISNSVSKRRARKRDEDRNDYLDRIASNTEAQNGTGVESSRAAERGSSSAASESEDYSLPTRDDRDSRTMGNGDSDNTTESQEELDKKTEELNAKAREAKSSIVEGTDAAIDGTSRRMRDNGKNASSNSNGSDTQQADVDNQ